MQDAEVRYAERHGEYLAYSVFGLGNHDLLVMQSRTPIDLMWELPQLTEFFEALGRLARVIVWDARGAGAPDPVQDGSISSNESVADDIRTVLDAADAERVTIFDFANGGSTITRRRIPSAFARSSSSTSASHFRSSSRCRPPSASDWRSSSRAPTV